MSFTEFFTALWRYRVAIAVTSAVCAAFTVSLLFVYHPGFQAEVIRFVSTVAWGLAWLLGIAFGLSLMWKAAFGKSGSKGGKK